MKSAGKARSNGLYRHIRTSKEIIRNLLNYCYKNHRIRDHRCRHARWSQPSTMFLVYKASNHKEFSIDLWNLDDLQ